MEKSLQEQQIETLQTADEYIAKLINGIDMCMNNIKENKQEESANLLSYIVEGIEWLNEVAKLTKDIQKENMDEEMMKEKLEKISQYANIGEYDKIFNLFNHEILSILSNWQGKIKNSIAS